MENIIRVRENELAVTRSALLEREEVLKDVKSTSVSFPPSKIGLLLILSALHRLAKVQSQLEATHKSNLDLQKELTEVGRREERANQAYTQCNSEKLALEAQHAASDSRLKEEMANLGQSRET